MAFSSLQEKESMEIPVTTFKIIIMCPKKIVSYCDPSLEFFSL